MGESDFVLDILTGTDEKFERSYELRIKGYNLKAIEKRVCEIFGIENDKLYQGCRRQTIADARGLFLGGSGTGLFGN
ncbi:hypothetical protein ACFL0M_15430 [Thermodesulfobacteriota bacterium]